MKVNFIHGLLYCEDLIVLWIFSNKIFKLKFVWWNNVQSLIAMYYGIGLRMHFYSTLGNLPKAVSIVNHSGWPARVLNPLISFLIFFYYFFCQCLKLPWVGSRFEQLSCCMRGRLDTLAKKCLHVRYILHGIQLLRVDFAYYIDFQTGHRNRSRVINTVEKTSDCKGAQLGCLWSLTDIEWWFGWRSRLYSSLIRL